MKGGKDCVEIAISHVGKRRDIVDAIIRRDATPRIDVCRDVNGELSESISNRRANDKGEVGIINV